MIEINFHAVLDDGSWNKENQIKYTLYKYTIRNLFSYSHITLSIFWKSVIQDLYQEYSKKPFSFLQFADGQILFIKIF